MNTYARDRGLSTLSFRPVSPNLTNSNERFFIKSFRPVLCLCVSLDVLGMIDRFFLCDQYRSSPLFHFSHLTHVASDTSHYDCRTIQRYLCTRVALQKENCKRSRYTRFLKFRVSIYRSAMADERFINCVNWWFSIISRSISRGHDRIGCFTLSWKPDFQAGDKYRFSWTSSRTRVTAFAILAPTVSLPLPPSPLYNRIRTVDETGPEDRGILISRNEWKIHRRSLDAIYLVLTRSGTLISAEMERDWFPLDLSARVANDCKYKVNDRRWTYSRHDAFCRNVAGVQNHQKFRRALTNEIST